MDRTEHLRRVYSEYPRRELAIALLKDFKEYVKWIHFIINGTEYDMEDVHRKICDILQSYTEQKNQKRNLMINCPPGCLSGETLIHINRKKSSQLIKIKDLYERFNHVWDDTPVFIRRAINGQIRLSKIENCVFKGNQLTWRLELEDGKVLCATGGHRIMTKDGFRKVEDLKIGDSIAVDNKKKYGTETKVKHLKDKDFCVGPLHPYGRYHKSGQCWRISLHRAVYESGINGLSLGEFRKRTYTDINGLKFVEPGYDIHHIDGNHDNNAFSNLEAITKSEHAKKHCWESNFGQGKIEYSKLKSIDVNTVEPVYDIQCEEIDGCEPNYNANGILVHNTGKSLLLQYWITWNFARNKQCMFCYVAYGERLIKKLSRESRNLMMTKEWEELFGKEMDPNDKSVLNYHLISGGQRSGLTAGTIQSGLLGLDAGNPASKVPFSGALLLDDINSPEVVYSLHEQTDTPETYVRKLATRRRTPKTPTISIMQRHAQTDFAGWVAEHEEEDWEFVVIPAIRDDGTSFYEKRYPIDDLRKIEKQQPYVFASMYQQDPMAAQGALFKHEWMRYYKVAPEKFKKLFITTDTAFTQTGDFTVFACWGLAEDGNLYLIRMRRGRWESPDVKKFLVEFFDQCNTAYKRCRRVYIENTLSGLSLIQALKKECPKMAIIDVKRGAKKSKRARIEDASIWVEAGRVWFKETDPHLAEVYSEMINYNPDDKNPRDDFLDNLADACQISFAGSTSSIYI